MGVFDCVQTIKKVIALTKSDTFPKPMLEVPSLLPCTTMLKKIAVTSKLVNFGVLVSPSCMHLKFKERFISSVPQGPYW